MARILRGDIRWANPDPTQGREQAGGRPVVIISHDVFNERSGTVIAMAITSREQKAGFPLTFLLDSAHMPRKSWYDTRYAMYDRQLTLSDMRYTIGGLSVGRRCF